MAADLKALWTSVGWRDEAESWIKQTLRTNGIEQAAHIEQQRLQFWSTQLTVPTDRGLFWFKESNPDQAFEAGLVAELADIVPDRVVIPLATDPHRGRLLSPDQGPTMYAARRSSRDVWATMVREFADLQRQLIGHEAHLLATGLTRLAPSEAHAFVRAALQRAQARPSTDPRHVETLLADRVRAVLPRLAEHGRLLESGPIPLSLEHNDLHHDNTFVPQAGQPLRFFDFGDSLWAHPFTTMCVPLEQMTDAWKVGPDSPDIRYVTDAYLEVWADLGTTRELRSLMRSALPFGQAHRLMSWERVLPYADEEALATFGGAIPGWLERLVTDVERLV